MSVVVAFSKADKASTADMCAADAYAVLVIQLCGLSCENFD
jgi:hypothetical protein